MLSQVCVLNVEYLHLKPHFQDNKEKVDTQFKPLIHPVVRARTFWLQRKINKLDASTWLALFVNAW